MSSASATVEREENQRSAAVGAEPGAVEFRRVSRHFGDVRAVDEVSFSIADGEFFAMLGPSGSGKTTCLRLIAGFERPDAGEVLIHGETTYDRAPYQRDVNTVFQDYALFPHMNVVDNVAYSLMVRGVDKKSRRRRAGEMLELVQLNNMSRRKPSQLSGGQRQRVALARALINKPRVLLLDEPLGALDLKLREQMQIELKALQRQLGITFVFVTHDQEEALSMSDRLAVFNHGRVEQIGSAEDVYENPATVFVAGFVGVSNILDKETARALLGDLVPHSTALALRPEKLLLSAPDAAAGDGFRSACATVQAIQYHGASTRYQVCLDNGVSLNVLQQNLGSARGFQPDETVQLNWRIEDIHPLRDAPA